MYDTSTETPKATDEESNRKRSRKNKTTPPSMNSTFIKEASLTPSQSASKSLWVRSPEDRRTQITDIVDESTKDIKDDLLSMNNELRTLTSQMTTCLNNHKEIKKENEELRKQNAWLLNQNSEIRKSLAQQEMINRKNNVKMWGIYESPNEGKFDCKRKVLSACQRIGISFHPQAIAQAYRVGPKTTGHNRAMVITFSHTDDRDFILQKSRVFSSVCRIRVENDLPRVMDEKRKELRPIMIAANKIVGTDGTNKYKASLHNETLVVNNHTYNVSSVKSLPQELRPETIYTPTKNGITGFFTKHSPLSNHHPATFKIKGKTYNCSEQYYMEQMALTFADVNTAKKMMAEKDPGAQKKLSWEIKNFNKIIWGEMKVEIMKIGITAKFSQNQHLKDFLLSTGDNKLVEANPKDFFWGAGMALQNPNLWKRNASWGRAENMLGQLLTDLRRELRRTCH